MQNSSANLFVFFLSSYDQSPQSHLNLPNEAHPSLRSLETSPPHWLNQPQKAPAPLEGPAPGQATFRPHWSFHQHPPLNELEGGGQ